MGELMNPKGRNAASMPMDLGRIILPDDRGRSGQRG
jgi:hypothetical protein